MLRLAHGLCSANNDSGPMMRRKIRILSLDGGGIRGILPGVILSHIETRLREREGAERRLADYFELIAGTSTGGILACGYLTPTQPCCRPRSANEVVDIYLKQGDEIFNVSLLQMFRGMGGVLDEKYNADALERTLDEFLGHETRLSDMLKPCLITAYDIRKRRTRFFNSTDASRQGRNFYVRDVARATSAAPTYFETTMIRSELGVGYPLIDGGVFANNPSMCAYAESRTLNFAEVLDDSRLPNRPSAKDMMIVSIGTGCEAEEFDFGRARDWGQITWIRPVLDIMMTAASEIVDYQLKQMFDTLDDERDRNDYLRLQPQLHDASPEMDNVTAENIAALHEAGLRFVDENETRLEALVDRLIELGPRPEPSDQAGAGQTTRQPR